uniref:(northern house mosquito) hypothetical protein n=1 Tax=Culex pipiens TaxID=7175 RepID=A0A8D8BXS2_CULPI
MFVNKMCSKSTGNFFPYQPNTIFMNSLVIFLLPRNNLHRSYHKPRKQPVLNLIGDPQRNNEHRKVLHPKLRHLLPNRRVIQQRSPATVFPTNRELNPDRYLPSAIPCPVGSVRVKFEISRVGRFNFVQNGRWQELVQ